MTIGLLATIVTIVIGALVGIVAGFVGGMVDDLLMRVSDFFLVLPTVVLALILAPIMLDVIGPNAQLFGIRSTLLVVVIVIGLTSWATTARVIRSQVLSLKERMFVDRARVIGSGSGRIMRRHILPNVVNLIVAQSVLTFATAVFTETTLAFIGLGDPTAPSWGQILNNAQSGGALGLGRVVVHRPARDRGRARGAGVHAGRQRARRRAQPQGAEPPVSDTVERTAPSEAPVAATAVPDAGRDPRPPPVAAAQAGRARLAAARGRGPRRAVQPPVGQRQGGRRRELPARRRRGARDRGRVGLRQDDDRALAGGAAAGQRADPGRARSSCSGSTSSPSPRPSWPATGGARSRSCSRGR